MLKRIIKHPHFISRAISIDSDCCHLPTTKAFSNKADKSCSNQFLSTSQSFSRPRYADIKKNCNTKVHGDGVPELVLKLAREPAFNRLRPCVFLRNASGVLPVLCFLLAPAGRKETVARDKLSPQKPPSSHLWFSRTSVQHSSGSSTIDLPSILTEFGAYSPDRACHGTLAHAVMPYRAFHDSATCLSRATSSLRAPN